MSEQLNLTAPVTFPSTTFYKVVEIRMQREAPEQIYIRLRGTNSEQKDFIYEGATALALIIALNKANLSTTSLEKRILNQLVADGKLAGTVSGSPD